jgi:hypothetical protein
LNSSRSSGLCPRPLILNSLTHKRCDFLGPIAAAMGVDLFQNGNFIHTYLFGGWG